MKRGPWYELQAAAGATFLESDGWELPAAFQSPAGELRVLKEAVGLSDLSGWGVLRLTGGSRLDFVQRLSTNDVLGLSPGQGAPTLFTTPIGRIVDLAFVLVREDDLLLLVGRGAAEKVAGWLRRHIFFNDDVVVEDLTEAWGLMGFHGPGAEVLVEELCGLAVDDWPPFHARVCQIEGTGVTLVRATPLGSEFALLVQDGPLPVLWKTLAAAVESAGGAPVGETALEAARIGVGWPRFGRELSEDYIPLEAGLKWAISFNKGCYVGQEVIARMETRQRLAKRLVVLGWAQGAGEAEVDAGDNVRVDGSQAGQVTSVAPLADRGMQTALAYVKADVAEPGREMTLVGAEGRLPARVLAVASR